MEKNIAEGLMFACLSGSRAYGSSVSGSDIDIRGVFAGPRQSLLSPFYQVTSANGTGDTLFYEFSRFLKLVIGQNPNILELLWTDEKNVLFQNPVWKPLLAMRDSLLSRELSKSYGGFAFDEKKRIIKVMATKTDLTSDDILRLRKASAHVLRLLRMAHEGLAEGYIKVYRDESSEYRAIRNGDISIETVLQEAEILDAGLPEAIRNSILPEHIGPEIIFLLSEVSQEAYQAIWRAKSNPVYFPSILKDVMEIPDGEPEPPRLKHVPNLNTQRVIVIDIEKTGYRIMGFPESIEIGAVELIHGQPTRTFHSWIKNETPISIYAENLHGISADFLKDQRSLREVMRDFNKFVGEDSLLVFHSAENDADTLEHDMPLAGLPAFERSRISCTAKMAKGLSLQSKKGHMLSLNALCDILNINHSLRDARGHSALLDANLTAECLIKMSHNANYQTLKSFGFEKTSLTSRRVKEQLAEIYKMTCEIDYENDNVVFQSSVAKIEVPIPPYPDTHYPQVMGRTFVIKNAQGEIDNPLGPAMYFTNQANILSGFYDQGVRGKILDIKDLEMQNTTIVKY